MQPKPRYENQAGRQEWRGVTHGALSGDERASPAKVVMMNEGRGPEAGVRWMDGWIGRRKTGATRRLEAGGLDLGRRRRVLDQWRRRSGTWARLPLAPAGSDSVSACYQVTATHADMPRWVLGTFGPWSGVAETNDHGNCRQLWLRHQPLLLEEIFP